MMDIAGARSSEWVSPSHPEVRHRLVADAGALVAALGVDGLHLHGLGYPGLTWDFSPAALQRFSADRGISGIAAANLLGDHYLMWTQWRAREVASLVEEIAAAARQRSPSVEIGLSVYAGSATDYRVQERTGQDLRLLAGVWNGSLSGQPIPPTRDSRRRGGSGLPP